MPVLVNFLIFFLTIRDKLVNHMELNNLFNKSQHGFVSGRSCTTQLLEFMEEDTQALDRGEDVDVIYLDFAKAFDKVPHKKALKETIRIWYQGQSLQLDEEFLSTGSNQNGGKSHQESSKEVSWDHYFSSYL